jgi:hypothetical protein
MKTDPPEFTPDQLAAHDLLSELRTRIAPEHRLRDCCSTHKRWDARPLISCGSVRILFRKKCSRNPDRFPPEAFSGVNLRLILNLRDTEIER